MFLYNRGAVFCKAVMLHFVYLQHRVFFFFFFLFFFVFFFVFFYELLDLTTIFWDTFHVYHYAISGERKYIREKKGERGKIFFKCRPCAPY